MFSFCCCGGVIGSTNACAFCTGVPTTLYIHDTSLSPLSPFRTQTLTFGSTPNGGVGFHEDATHASAAVPLPPNSWTGTNPFSTGGVWCFYCHPVTNTFQLVLLTPANSTAFVYHNGTAGLGACSPFEWVLSNNGAADDYQIDTDPTN